ncbi:MAG: Lrp/AsnC family transcriptional regulator [Candidatus Methanoperedens sp.]|nr:Lrp/AsnC family transcriptional regulator [Candidatus Methanoperedens sp.]MCZ7360226.1 Lrp/AsnC family transcriptional regulator [Candidatus Methanoperedens sp.]HLB70153.1 Lrp/AsnC family transcriptional regulator [Candidatus Methanoperedens sp.]
MREFLDLDKRDREILSLMEKDPEMSQNDIAEKLKISQPSVSARIHKLKQKGALAHVVGMNLKKVHLYMAKVDVIANNTSSVLDIFKDCPYFLNGLIVSGKHNLCLFFVGEDIATLEAIVDGHLRNNPAVQGAEVSIVITPMKDLILPLRMNFDFSNDPPCGIGCNCKECAHHASNRCLGCPVTNSYSGKIWK